MVLNGTLSTPPHHFSPAIQTHTWKRHTLIDISSSGTNSNDQQKATAIRRCWRRFYEGYFIYLIIWFSLVKLKLCIINVSRWQECMDPPASGLRCLCTPLVTARLTTYLLLWSDYITFGDFNTLVTSSCIYTYLPCLVLQYYLMVFKIKLY